MNANGGTEQMSELESALDRLGDAVASLIAASDQGHGAEVGAPEQIAVLTTERDRLQGEIDELRALREDDARLHADAAEAVRIALKDLRSLAALQEQAGQE
jgi:ABC-type transporter Mla subunit MlaD